MQTYEPDEGRKIQINISFHGGSERSLDCSKVHISDGWVLCDVLDKSTTAGFPREGIRLFELDFVNI